MTAMPERSDAVLLDVLLGPLAEALREIGLPLHILLENRFGELNENQVEMIAAARASAEEADILLRRAERVRAIERQPRLDRDETTRPIDLCRGALAIASAREASRGIRFETDLSPALPRVRGDRAHLEEALTLLFCDAAMRAPAHGAITLAAREDAASAVHLVIGHSAPPPLTLDLLLARRLVESTGGEVEDADGMTHIRWRY